MRLHASSELSDDELFAEITQGRAAGDDVSAALGTLCERWKKPAFYVIRKIQASYGRRSADDEEELFQDAVGKFLERGLDQFRGVSEHLPGKAASPKTFFLRIVKHVAIDRYRRQREVLDSGSADDELPSESERMDAARSVEDARRREERSEASEIYWQAFRRLQAEHPNEAGAWDLYHHQDVDDHAECAARLGISVANSYKRVSRAQAYLKLYLLELQHEE